MAYSYIQFAPSSNIANIAYDPDTLTLLVQYKQGQVYGYSPVSTDVVYGLSQAEKATLCLRTYIVGQAEEKRIE